MTAPATDIPIPSAPSKPREQGAINVGSQRDRRFTDTFFDTYRHPRFPQGRPFTGQREFQSGSATESIAAGFLQSDLQCGEYFCENPDMGQTLQERAMTLASAWVAPWLMPGGRKYMKFDYRRKRITFLYEKFIEDERAALGQYWIAAAKLAGESDVIDPARPLAVPFRIRTLLGAPTNYTNKVRLAQACIAGDPWLMGAVPEPNEELAKLLGLSAVQYVGGVQYGDAEYVTAPTPKAPEPLMQVEEVLAVPMDKVQQMIADALAAHDAKQKAEKKAVAERLKAGRDKKKAAASA